MTTVPSVSPLIVALRMGKQDGRVLEDGANCETTAPTCPIRRCSSAFSLG